MAILGTDHTTAGVEFKNSQGRVGEGTDFFSLRSSEVGVVGKLIGTYVRNEHSAQKVPDDLPSLLRSCQCRVLPNGACHHLGVPCVPKQHQMCVLYV